MEYPSDGLQTAKKARKKVPESIGKFFTGEQIQPQKLVGFGFVSYF
jgi:hypothetical protein